MRSEGAVCAGVLEEEFVRAPERTQTALGNALFRLRANVSAEVWVAVLATVCVVGVRLWWTTQVTFCGTPDSCFYLGLAQGLERTGSFQVNFLYDLLLPKLQLPNPGIEYWRPGTSFFLLGSHLLGGVTLQRGAVISTLAGVVWAASAWKMARQGFMSKQLAMPSYLLALLLPPAWIDSLSTDSTLFYAMASAWCLALFTVERQGWAQDILALMCVAVAYFIRNDAVLLLAPLGVVLFLRRRAAGRHDAVPGNRASTPQCSRSYAALLLAGFALALAPMHLVYLRVLGTAFPRGAMQALWMNDLSDFQLYGVQLTAKGLFAHGLTHFVAVRGETLALIGYRVMVLLLGYAGLLFLPAGVWSSGGKGRGKQLPEAAGPLVFAAAILVVYGLVMPAIGVFSALRSAVALLPWMAVLVMTGLSQAVPQERVRRPLCALLLMSYAVSGSLEARRMLRAMNQLGARDRAWAEQLIAMGAHPETAVVMIGDPVQFAVTTGFHTVPVPGNGLDAVRSEARALRVSHAMLDTNQLRRREADVASVLRAVQGVPLPEEHGVVLLELGREAR